MKISQSDVFRLLFLSSKQSINPKDSSFIINDKEKQQILIFKKLELKLK